MSELQQSAGGDQPKEGLVSWDQLEDHMHRVDQNRQDLESRVEGIRRAQSALRRQVQERNEREPGNRMEEPGKTGKTGKTGETWAKGTMGVRRI